MLPGLSAGFLGVVCAASIVVITAATASASGP